MAVAEKIFVLYLKDEGTADVAVAASCADQARVRLWNIIHSYDKKTSIESIMLKPLSRACGQFRTEGKAACRGCNVHDCEMYLKHARPE